MIFGANDGVVMHVEFDLDLSNTCIPARIFCGFLFKFGDKGSITIFRAARLAD